MHLDTINVVDHDSGLACCMPDWAKFYLSLGRYSSIEPTGQLRKVVILSVPTRHFCSSMISAGAIYQVAKEFIPDATSKEIYFKKLINLPDGTSIRRRNPTTKNIIKGVSVSSENPDNETDFRFRTHKGNQKVGPVISLLNMEQCWAEIEIDSSNEHKLPVGHKSKIVDDGAKFRSHLFDNKNADKFFSGDNEAVCLLIGVVNTLEEEISQDNLIISEVGVKGSIHDIIRADKLNKDSGYKTKLLSDRNMLKPLIEKIPRLVIFDGARSFLKWNSLFTKSNVVVILDRSESTYEDGVLLANDNFENRKEDLNLPDSLIEEIPIGVEVMSCLAVI